MPLVESAAQNMTAAYGMMMNCGIIHPHLTERFTALPVIRILKTGSHTQHSKKCSHTLLKGKIMTNSSHKTTSHWATWDQAFGFLLNLIPERRRGAELKRSASKDPKKKWVVIEDHGVEDANT